MRVINKNAAIARKIMKSKLSKLNLDTPIASRYFGGIRALREAKEKTNGKTTRESIMTTRTVTKRDSNFFVFASG